MCNTKTMALAFPTIQVHRANAMLGMIDANTYIPEKVYVYSSRIETAECMRQPRRVNKRVDIRVREGVDGVNWAWNCAMQETLGGSYDFLMLINDDVLISPLFFQRTYQVLDALAGNERGILAPATTSAWSRYKSFDELDHACANVTELTKRQGSVFILSRELIQELPPIPDELVYFYGDDWIYHWCRHLSYPVLRYDSTLVFHEVGGTTRQDVDRFRAIRKAEGKAYRRLIKEVDRAR